MDRVTQLSQAMHSVSVMLGVLHRADIITDDEYNRIEAAIWGVVVDAKNRKAEIAKQIEEAVPL